MNNLLKQRTIKAVGRMTSLCVLCREALLIDVQYHAQMNALEVQISSTSGDFSDMADDPLFEEWSISLGSSESLRAVNVLCRLLLNKAESVVGTKPLLNGVA